MRSRSKSTVLLFFAFVLLFALCSGQVATSWLNFFNWIQSFLSGTNAGTMWGYKRSKDGTVGLAQQIVNLPEFSAVQASLNWWLYHNNACAYCLTNMPSWDTLISQVSDWYAKEILKMLQSMEARLSLAWPTFCDRWYDRCFMVPGGPVPDKLCTRAYCFFNPDAPCSMRGYAAQCKSLQWMKDNNIKCPLPCRTLKKRDELMTLIRNKITTKSTVTDSRSVQARALAGLGRSAEEVAKKAGSVQLREIGTKRQYCGYSVSCANCPTSNLNGGCLDRSPVTGETLCCDCFVHPVDQDQSWKRDMAERVQ